jgi:ribonuclease BN (tRNA processing enzyme)
MKVRILGSAPQHPAVRQYVSSYLINDCVAIDASCLGMYGAPQDQAAVDHVFLTHSHADHCASLPIFLENRYGLAPQCPLIYGSQHTLDSLQKHIFNDVVWPDFIKLSAQTRPFLRLRALEAEEPVEAERLCITPVAVNHVVPTFAYLVSDGQATVLFCRRFGPYPQALGTGAATTLVARRLAGSQLPECYASSGADISSLDAADVRGRSRQVTALDASHCGSH